MLLFLPGITFADIEAQNNIINQSIFINTRTSHTSNISTEVRWTSLPATFTDYSDPEWTKMFNMRCAFCDAPVTTRPRFIPINIDSNGIMYPHGVFDKYICAFHYLAQSSRLDKNLAMNIRWLFNKEYGYYPQLMPLTQNRLDLIIYGGHILVMDFYAKLKTLEEQLHQH
jgi:hypothetical protein